MKKRFVGRRKIARRKTKAFTAQSMMGRLTIAIEKCSEQDPSPVLGPTNKEKYISILVNKNKK